MKAFLSVDPETVITDIYPKGSRTRELLLRHGEQVAKKAFIVIDNAHWLTPDRDFVFEAAMLHDIGVGRTLSPKLGCSGSLPYLCHGVEGRRILDDMGLTLHGRVCECHVGVGIRAEQILRRRLPLPVRDMVPVTVEERIVCYADKFFSKGKKTGREKSTEEITAGLAQYGPQEAKRFMDLHRSLTLPPRGNR